MINHLITVPGDNVTIKTKASHRPRLFKAKSCFLNADSGVQLDGSAFKNTSLLHVVTQHRRGLTRRPFLFYNEVLQFTFHPVTENQRFCKTGTAQSKTSLTSISFSLLKGREGHTHTEGSQRRAWQPGIKPQQGSATDWRAGGCTQRAVQAFIGPFPSHLSHKIGFVGALPSAEKAKVDYGRRRG